MDDQIRRLEDQDEGVRIAVKALGTMRNSGGRVDASRTLPPISTSPAISPPLSPPVASTSASPSSEHLSDPSSPAGLVSRMSHFPLVGSAMRVYEQGKASSRVVKYGAEMVESSVKTISRPVIERLPVNVNQLDEFACRQLDRLDRYRRPSNGSTDRTGPSSSSPDRGRPRLKTKTLDGSALDDEDDDRDVSMQRDSRERSVPIWLESTSNAPPPVVDSTRSSTPTQGRDDSQPPRNGEDQREVAQRSRWQAVLLEAGGLSAALSEDSMRRLKYCLQWLQYATAHIDAQILILRDFTASLQPLPSDNLSANRRPPISEEHLRKLTDVRRDIVHTIRQVVDVVSKYAGGALPEPARNRVRGFILKLPQRWASKAGPAAAAGGPLNGNGGERETVAAAGHGTGAFRRAGGQRRAAQRERGTGASSEPSQSKPPSRATSPSASPRIGRGPASESSSTALTPMTHSSAELAAQRILALATESLDMMRNVTGVVKDSLDRADAWVGRLRTVGIQRGAHEGEDSEEFEIPGHMRHRRTGSTVSSNMDDEHASEPGMPPSPFLSGSSSTNWGSSIPSTPGGSFSQSSYADAGRDVLPTSPGGSILPIGSMSLNGSTYNTPRSVIVGLPEDEERDDRKAMKTRASGPGTVKVAGLDDVERKMDVDG